MKMRATTNQLGLAPMRIPKTRASWIDPVPIRTHGGRRRSSWRADAPTQRAMRLPAPRRMPDLGNVRLSVKLGLCFGAILRAHGRNHRRRRAQRRGPRGRAQSRHARRRAADHRRAAGRGGLRRPALLPDGRWSSTGGQHARGRDRRPGRRREGRRRPAQQRPASKGSAARRGRRLGRDRHVEDPRRQALRSRQAGRHAATPSRPSPATPTRRPTTSSSRHRALHRAGRACDRAQADERFATLESAATRTTHHPRRAGPAGRARSSPSAIGRHLSAPPASRVSARRRGARRGRRRSRARRRAAATRSGAPPARWPRWSSTSARWPAPPTASPPATSPSTSRRAPSATASAPPSPASWPSCAPP